MEKSTIVCRCEEINIEEIELAIKNGARTFDDIKRLTRCGMGPCQAKICMNPVREIIATYTNTPLEDIPPPRLRMPAIPVRMGALANGVEDFKESSIASVFGESVEDGDEQNDESV